MNEIDSGSNIMGSQVGYRIKQNDDNTYRLKARLEVHGNEDAMKEDARRDAATAHLLAVRSVLSLAVCYKLEIGNINIESNYFESGKFNGLYICDPHERRCFCENSGS